MTTNTNGPAELRRLTKDLRDGLPGPSETCDELDAYAAAWESDRAALERARALVADTSVPHSQWCLVHHGGPCDCYKARLAAALGEGGRP